MWQTSAREASQTPELKQNPHDFNKQIAEQLLRYGTKTSRKTLITLPTNTIDPGGRFKVKGLPMRVAAVVNVQPFIKKQHERVRRHTRAYCAYCGQLGKASAAVGGHQSKLSRGLAGNWRGTETDRVCRQCNVTLCVKTSSKWFELYHVMKKLK